MFSVDQVIVWIVVGLIGGALAGALMTWERGGYGLDAQWSDDFHHAIHTYLTGERHGYYQDFAGIATIADVYRETLGRYREPIIF